MNEEADNLNTQSPYPYNIHIQANSFEPLPSLEVPGPNGNPSISKHIRPKRSSATYAYTYEENPGGIVNGRHSFLPIPVQAIVDVYEKVVANLENIKDGVCIKQIHLDSF